MRNVFLIFCLLLAGNVVAQPAVTLTGVPKRLGYYVVATNANNMNVVNAVAMACMKSAGSDTVIDVVILRDDFVEVFSRLASMPEGVATKPNDELYDLALPVVLTDSVLLSQMLRIQGGSAATRSDIEQEGLRIVESVQISIRNNE